MADRDPVGREAPIVITPRAFAHLVRAIVGSIRRKRPATKQAS